MRYAFGAYTLDAQRYELHRAGKPVLLRPKAFEVLTYLVAHRDRVVSKDELLERLWSGQFVSDATVNSCIKEVRRAIGDRGAMPRLLRTVRGRGYRFVAPVTEANQPRPEDVQPATPAPAPPAADEPLSPSTPAAAELGLSPTEVPDTGEEYKAVTALCFALAEAPALAERLGPEAMHRVMQAVVAQAQDVVQRYEGAIVHLTGEGFTALFGAPMAQEDHARRAVLAALELRQRLHDHPAIRTHTGGEALAVRMGLHTGPAVVGHLPCEPQRLYTAVGATTHLAARLQQRAAPGAILISAAAHRLVQAEVRAEARAIREGDGRSPAALAYALQGLVQQRAGVPGWRGRPLSRFVGRAREMAVLQARLALAAQGQGQVVGIAGEPGMGKSRLLYEFAHSLRGRSATYREAHCLAHGSATPYLVVRALLRQICGLSEADGPEAIAAKVQRSLQEAGTARQDEAALLLALLDVAVDAPQLAALDPQARKARTFALLHRLTLREGQRQPLVLAVENLHWIDATSEEWLAALVDRLAGAAVLLLTTYRPGHRPPWLDKSYATQLALPGLTPTDSLAVVRSVARAAPLPGRLTQEIVAKAAGNPFFLEELTRSAVEGGGRDAARAIPDSVQAVLAARIDRLPPAEKRLLQTMAVIGKDAPVPLLRAVAALPEEVLYRHLDHLQAAEFLSQSHALPRPVYTFNHALIQEVAYQSLLRRTRRDLHGRIAQTLAEGFPDVAATQPERLAHHYTEAGMHEPALDWWRRAGARALERSAYVEAISHLGKGLAALAALPPTPERLRQELDLQIALGPALSAAKGAAAPEVERAYARARVLGAQVGDTPQLFPTLRGLWRFYLNRGALSTAQELGERLLQLARREAEGMPLLEAHEALGTTLFFRGEYAAARQHLEQSLALVDPMAQRHLALHRGLALGVTALAYTANALWCLGYPRQAVQRCQEALALAEALAHPHSLAFARHYAAFLHYRRREASAAHKHAEACLAVATAQGLPLWAGLGQCMRGWALAMEGHGEAGLAQLQQGLAAVLATGQGISRAACLVLWAEAAGQAGQVEDGLRLLTEALAAFEASGRSDGLVEAYRLRGEFLLRRATPDAGQAEACFQQALAVARRQQAKSWELRAALSLARLWRRRGNCIDATELLAPLYGWFTEGFDTADLQEAHSMLHDATPLDLHPAGSV